MLDNCVFSIDEFLVVSSEANLEFYVVIKCMYKCYKLLMLFLDILHPTYVDNTISYLSIVYKLCRIWNGQCIL